MRSESALGERRTIWRWIKGAELTNGSTFNVYQYGADNLSAGAGLRKRGTENMYTIL